ncbi:Cna B-type domain-containing protein [Carnobacteriaceae bacterium zg-ZUI78]|nr:Cna B-type domain-containing protein [Carnobacteriaceae bacterium zg-ZUI78]
MSTKRLKWHSMFVVFFTCLFCMNLKTIYATTVTVNTQDELIQALESNSDNILINSSFEISRSIDLSQKTVEITASDGVELTTNGLIENMFIASGGQVTFENVRLNGNNQSRLFLVTNGAALTLKNTIVKKGTTQLFEKNIIDTVNKQRYSGGAIFAEHATLNLENVEFIENTTKKDTPVVEKPGDPILAPHGGAIYAGTSTINIVGGRFSHNRSGSSPNGSNGEGGAIKLEGGSKLYINKDAASTDKTTTVFEENSNDDWQDKGGYQGGAIEATESEVVIYGTTFKVAGPFNTGGAIKFQNVPHAEVHHSDFILLGLKGEIGVAGGAITSEGSHLTISNTTMSVGDGTRVKEAGGLIQVVGSGTFNLLDSTLVGRGAFWNAGRYTAKYGGAISFYTGSTVTAKIENTIIRDFMADVSGAAIAVSNQRDAMSGVDLTLKNTRLINNAAYTYGNWSYGGGMFIGPGNTVLMDSGIITGPTYSNNAGAIYNQGNLTLTGGANISGNNAYQMVGGIYNAGYLKVDNATIQNNSKGDWATGYDHQLKKGEYSGENIYAAKDVIITPNSTIQNGDVRVLEGQSSIILTGALTKPINVSISETPKLIASGIATGYIENANRHVGYVVARGANDNEFANEKLVTNSYEATREDAKLLHYVSKDTIQPIAPLSDHTSVGMWDFVLNPMTKQVVLGQRAKMIYHANGGTFDSGTEKEFLYTIYSSTDPWTDIPQLKLLDDASQPTRPTYALVGWYNHHADGTEDNNPITDAEIVANRDANLFDFSLRFASGTTPITNIVTPNVLHAYAGWEKQIQVQVTKHWASRVKETSVTVQLYKNGNPEGNPVQLTENGNWTYTFMKLSKYKSENLENVYTVKEVGEENNRVTVGDHTYTVNVEGNQENGYTITNTYVPGKTEYTVNKVWMNGPTEKPTISVQLYQNGAVYGKAVELTSGTTNHTWRDLPATDNTGVAYTYTVDEVNVPEGYEKAVVDNTITNTYVPGKTEYTVNKVWVNGPTEKPTISVQLYQNGAVYGEVVELTSGTTSHTWRDLPATDNSGVAYTYTVDEVNVPAGYEKAVVDNTITNTYVPGKTEYTVNKVWVNGPTEKPTISVQLYQNGAVYGKAVELTSGTTSHTWRDLPATDNTGVAYTYTVDEVNVPAGYEKAVVDNTITNTYVPQKTRVSVTKVWRGNVSENSVQVQLYKNGEAIGAPVTLNESNQWKHDFTNLLVVDTSEQPTPNIYTVKEVGEANNRVTVGDHTYTVNVEGTQANGYTITNTYVEPIKPTPLQPGTTSVSVTKVWRGNVSENSVQVQLYKNGEVIGAPVTLNESNQWKYEFTNLLVVDTPEQATPNIYTVKEVGEANNRITVGDHTYTVNVEGTQANGYTITNTYVEPIKPTPLQPGKTTVSVTKVWRGNVSENSVQVQLYKNGEVMGTPVTLNESNQWEYEFTDLLVVDTPEQATPNIYTVKEVGEANNRITVGDHTYTVNVEGTQANGYTITNTYVEPIKPTPLQPGTTSVSVTKVWRGNVRENSVQVQLYKNGEVMGAPVTLNESNQWKHEFTDLFVVDTPEQAIPNVYTVKEIGEANNRVTVGDHTYTVNVEGTQKNGYTITNTYVEPIVPTNSSNLSKVLIEENKNSILPKTGTIDSSIYSLVLFVIAGVVYSFRNKKE